MLFNFNEEPTDVFNCEYFRELKRQFHAGELDQSCIRASFQGLPYGQKIIAWLERPINPNANNIHTLAKFDE